MFQDIQTLTYDEYATMPDRHIETDSIYMALAAIGNMLHNSPRDYDKDSYARTNEAFEFSPRCSREEPS